MHTYQVNTPCPLYLISRHQTQPLDSPLITSKGINLLNTVCCLAAQAGITYYCRGPPGAGKSMLAQGLASLMPTLQYPAPLEQYCIQAQALQNPSLATITQALKGTPTIILVKPACLVAGRIRNLVKLPSAPGACYF